LKLIGNVVHLIDESYTSRCSFLDNEQIEKHEKYMRRRVNRGLFKSKKGFLINADVNGAYNIFRKVFPNAISVDGIVCVCEHPRSLNWKKQLKN
jgi:putative transposase